MPATQLYPEAGSRSSSPAVVTPQVLARRVHFKRQRLTQKTSDQSTQFSTCSTTAAGSEVDASEACVTAEAGSASDKSRIYEMLRKQHWRNWSKKANQMETPDGLQRSVWLRQKQRQAFAQLSKEKKAVLTKQAMADVGVSLEDAALLKKHLEMLTLQGQRSRDRLQGKTAMLTHNGEWGLLKEPIPEEAKATLEALTRWVQQRELVATLWREYQAWAEKVEREHDLSRFTVTFEICPQTWRLRQEVRIHGHAVLTRTKRWNVETSDPSFLFRGSKPHRVTAEVCKMRTAASCNSAHYYAYAPKRGTVFACATAQPFQDYQVRPEWITARIQDGKFTTATAKQQYVECGRCLPEMLRNLQVLEQEHHRRKELDLKSKVSRLLAQRRRPVQPHPQVMAWLERTSEADFRQPFLVMEGPSKTGETQFLLSLFPGRVLELNCASCAAPDLRGFRRDEHDLVLCDEARPATVVANKKLFQCGNCDIVLGESPTMQSSYSVYLWGIRIAIASNSWTSLCKNLPEEEQAWLRDNCVHVQVSAPLFAP